MPASRRRCHSRRLHHIMLKQARPTPSASTIYAAYLLSARTRDLFLAGHINLSGRQPSAEPMLNPVQPPPYPITRSRPSASVNARKSRSRVSSGIPRSIQHRAIRASPRRALRGFASTCERSAPARCQYPGRMASKGNRDDERSREATVNPGSDSEAHFQR